MAAENMDTHADEIRMTSTQGGSHRATTASPVDDRTYNVLQALTSTLESIAAYETYLMDDGDEFFRGLLQDEQEHASLLLDELRARLAA